MLFEHLTGYLLTADKTGALPRDSAEVTDGSGPGNGEEATCLITYGPC